MNKKYKFTINGKERTQTVRPQDESKFLSLYSQYNPILIETDQSQQNKKKDNSEAYFTANQFNYENAQKANQGKLNKLEYKLDSDGTRMYLDPKSNEYKREVKYDYDRSTGVRFDQDSYGKILDNVAYGTDTFFKALKSLRGNEEEKAKTKQLIKNRVDNVPENLYRVAASIVAGFYDFKYTKPNYAFGYEGRDETEKEKKKREEDEDLIIKMYDNLDQMQLGKDGVKTKLGTLKLKDAGVGIVKGAKQASPSDVIAGVFGAGVSMAETYIPAMLTGGRSLPFQIAAPMYTDYNQAKAKQLYGDEPDAVERLIRDNKTELTTPLVLGAVATGLEYVGFKGIQRYIASIPGKSGLFANLFLTGNREGLTEVGQLVVEKLNTELGAGKSIEEASISAYNTMTGDEVFEMYLNGFLGATQISVAGKTVNDINRAVRGDEATTSDINNKISNIANLNFRKNTTKNKKAKEAIDIEIKAAEKDLKDYIIKTRNISKVLNNEQKQSLTNILKEKDNIDNKINDLNLELQKGNITRKEYGYAVRSLNNQNKRLSNQIVDIKKQVLEAASKRQVETVKKQIEEIGLEGKITEMTAEEISKMDLGKIDAKKAAGEFGFIKQFKDGSFEIVINKDKPTLGTAAHEFLHAVLNTTLSKNKNTQNALAAELIKHTSKLKSEGTENLSKRLDEYKDDAALGEEVITVMSESIMDGSLKYDDGFFTRIGDIVRRFLQNTGLKEVRFDTGRDVYNFIKDYNESIRTGKVNKAIIKVAKEGAKGKLVERTDTEIKADEIKFSRDAKPQVDELGKMGWTAETWKTQGSDFAISEMKQNNMLDRLIASKLKVPMSVDKTKEFVSKVYAELTSHAKNFNPEVNDSFFGWINSQIANKAGNVYNREYKVEQRTQDIDARTEEGAPAIQVEADITTEQEFIDRIGLTEEQQVEYSKLRRKLKLDDSMMNKVRDAVIKTFGTKLPDVESKKFRNELEKRYRTELKKPIQDMIGTRENYTKFLKNNFESVYNALPVETLVQMERNLKPENRIFTTSKRITKPTEVDRLISEGRLPKDTNRTSGPQLHNKNKYPGEEKVLAFFRGTDMKNKLGYEVGNSTLGTRKDKLAMEIGVELGFDATSETIQRPEIIEKRRGILELDGKDQKQNEIAIIAKQIDRDPTIKFSKSKMIEEVDLLDNLVSELGIENVIQDGKLLNEFPKMSKAAVKIIQDLYNKNITLDESAKAFKQSIFKSDIIPTRIKAVYKTVGNLRFNEAILDLMHKDSSVAALELGPEIMNTIGYELLGYKNRTMDPAKKKQDGSKGKYYDKLNNLKEKVNKKKVKLPPGLVLKDVRMMNKSFPLFKKIDKILSLKSKKEKLKQLKALQPEIDAANVANIKLAKHIASTIITLAKSNKINSISALNILQSQTSIVQGFRGLSRLDLIDVREGSQTVSEANPQYKEAVSYYKKKGVKNPKEKALERLGSKGEHLAPNSNTMRDIAELIYKKDVDINTELDLVFANHSQLLTSKFITDVIDDGPGGKTSTADFNRIKFLKQADINNIVSAEGKSYQDVLVDTKIRSMQMEGIGKAKLRQAKAFDLRKAHNNTIKFSKSGEAKGMSTFDFDETLIIDGENFVVATDPKTGKKINIKSGDWPIKGPELAAQGYEFNFDDFVNVRGGVDGPLLQKMKNQIKKYGPENVFVLTARPQEAATAIDGWLKSKGINIPFKNITGLADSKGEAKANWMLEKFAEGYNDMYFVDDALPNVEAVKNVLEQLDIKSKVVQAKIKFSKQAPLDLDKILEETKGVNADRKFTASEAMREGARRSRFKFFVPPSAEDFKGLLYSFLGKGRKGDAHMKFFKETLLDPYAKGYREWNAYKQAMSDDYQQVKKQFKNVGKKLKNKVRGTSFDNEAAIRVYLWNKADYEIQGINEEIKNKLVEQVENNPDLKAFAEALSVTTRVEEGYVEPNEFWAVENIASDLTNAVNKVGRKQFLAEWIDNKNIIFSIENMNKIEAIYGTDFRDALENILHRMETGTNRVVGKDKTVNKFLDWINGSVGAVMFFNIRSAALQTISTINFVNASDNNMFRAAAAFANQPQFWKDFSFIFNSSMLKQRRAGLQIDVSASELTKVFADSGNKSQAVINWLLEKGFKPTQIADSFAISAGGATFYRNRIKKYIREGMSETKAKEQAFLDFQEIAEETQQSSRPDLISAQQAGVLGRIILAWQNTPMQMTRLTKKSISDLVNRRRIKGLNQFQSDKANISRIMYYGLIQNLIFGALQTGLAFLLFGWDEDEERKKKLELRVANGALDTILRGTGVYGAAVSTLKNTLMKWREESQKGWKRDDLNIALEAISLSPPLGSKLRKIISATRTEKYNKGVSEEIGFRIENPNISIAANWTEALLNIPVARVVNKANNVEEAITGNHDIWQRVALVSGWNRWDIGVKDEELEEAKQAVKDKKKKQKQKEKQTTTKKVRCVRIKSNGQRCKNKTDKKNKRCYAHQ